MVLEEVFESWKTLENSGKVLTLKGGAGRIGSWVAGGGAWFALSALVHILLVDCRILVILLAICDTFYFEWRSWASAALRAGRPILEVLEYTCGRRRTSQPH
jgi:hypothetical protein